MQVRKHTSVSIIIPACNEQKGLEKFLPGLVKRFPDFEILIVDDGSEDETATFARSMGVRVIQHPYRIGNGAAIKTGARHAQGDAFIFMDADAQHRIDDIENLIQAYQSGYDMVVGKRSKEGQASVFRAFANHFYNRMASLIVNQKVEDLTSGFRVVNAKKFKEFLHLLPNGFSYPSTITLAFFRSGYTVHYVDVHVEKRVGKSHLRPLTDGVRFLIILYKITILYSPLKVFLPLGFLHLILGLGHYAHTYLEKGRFTNMSALLITTAIVIFLIGLVSEQITTLIYQNKRDL